MPNRNEEEIQELLGKLAGRISGTDDETLAEEALKITKPLEELCTTIERSQHLLKEIKDSLDNFFQNSENNKALTPKEFAEYVLHHQGELFFTNLYSAFRGIIMPAINCYLLLPKNLKLLVTEQLKTSKGKKQTTATVARAILEGKTLAATTTTLFAELKTNLPRVLEYAQNYTEIHNKYLKDRFIEHEEEPADKASRIIRHPEEERTEYVKIKLVDDNPVLTDVLLNFVEQLPQYRERTIKEPKKRTKKIREISAFAVERSAGRLLRISDPRLYGYITNSKQYFQNLANIVKDFYCFLQLLEIPNESIHTNASTKIFCANSEIQEAIEQPFEPSIQRNLNKMNNTDFEEIVQSEDDILPENRREKDYFKLRDKLLEHLHKSIKEFEHEFTKAPRDKYDYETYEKDLVKADEIVTQAIQIKAEIDNLLISQSTRKLRKDKQTDNEYYEGMQGDIHTGDLFSFERKPAPNVKLDDVVGKSFETAKTHLRQIIETAEYPHVMRLSAPDGKVRSNIMLIGPYGCGKTYLAKAVCGDKRIIGASVSVSSTLTAWMHESVNNARRVYDSAKQLYIDGREHKPVVLVLDEFDSWFATGMGTMADTDMQQIKNVLQEILDGMGDYHGIITMAMTNEPLAIPPAIFRRFRYVDIVGQLSQQEIATVLKNNLEKTLPLANDVEPHYERWAQKLEGAVGDVIRKIADEIHAEILPAFIKEHQKEAKMIQRALYRRESNHGISDDKDITYLKEKLRAYKTVTAADVDKHVESILARPQIVLQINKAKQLYEDAQRLLDDLSSGSSHPTFGFRKTKDTLFGINDD